MVVTGTGRSLVIVEYTETKTGLRPSATNRVMLKYWDSLLDFQIDKFASAALIKYIDIL